MVIVEIDQADAEGDALVTVAAGAVRVVAFAFPFVGKIGDVIDQPLILFDARNVMISRLDGPGIWAGSLGPLSRFVVATLVNLHDQVFAVGDMLLQLDGYMPGGIEVGDLVEMECARIDLE